MRAERSYNVINDHPTQAKTRTTSRYLDAIRLHAVAAKGREDACSETLSKIARNIRFPLSRRLYLKELFTQVSLQVMLSHIVVHASDAAFYKAPEPLDCICMRVANHVHTRAVIDATMLISLLL